MTPETQPPLPNDINDIVTIDSYNRGHRPDGKFLSDYELDQVADNQALIRSGLEQGVVNQAEVLVRSEEAKLSAALTTPDIDTDNHSSKYRLSLKRFFDDRQTQLRAFSREIAGVQVSGRQWLKSRLHPSQLGHNAKGNLANILGLQYDYDRVVDNPVLKDTFYRQATQGDSKALAYLRRHDPNFGETEMTLGEAAKEAATILSGLALARKVGRLGLAGATLLSLQHTELGTTKSAKLEGRMAKIRSANQYAIGTKRFEQREQAYRELRLASGKRPLDPFA